ncbi:hypothetical protein [Hymenobacter tenuis]
MRYLLLGTFVLAAFVSTEAHAQLESTSPAQQRAAKRRALRESAQYKAEYKESHLNVTKQELTPLAGGRQAAVKPTAERASYKFDRTGLPRVSEPSRISFRLRKKKDVSLEK